MDLASKCKLLYQSILAKQNKFTLSSYHVAFSVTELKLKNALLMKAVKLEWEMKQTQHTSMKIND